MNPHETVLQWAQRTAAARLAELPGEPTPEAPSRPVPAWLKNPRPGSGAAVIARLCASGDAFDRHDIEEQTAGLLSPYSIGSMMCMFVQAGRAKIKVRGGWWVPASGGPAICRATLWVGTEKARKA